MEYQATLSPAPRKKMEKGGQREECEATLSTPLGKRGIGEQREEYEATLSTPLGKRRGIGEQREEYEAMFSFSQKSQKRVRGTGRNTV